MIHSSFSFSPAHGGRLKYRPSLELGGVYSACVSPTREAGASCVQGLKDKGKELMAVPATCDVSSRRGHSNAGESRSGYLSVQWKQKLVLHARNEDKDARGLEA